MNPLTVHSFQNSGLDDLHHVQDRSNFALGLGREEDGLRGAVQDGIDPVEQ
jgi:hypothetical protein